MTERTPFWCHCAECGHEFYPFSMPIPAAEMPQKVTCPDCNSKKIMCGKKPRTAEEAQR